MFKTSLLFFMLLKVSFKFPGATNLVFKVILISKIRFFLIYVPINLSVFQVLRFNIRAIEKAFKLYQYGRFLKAPFLTHPVNSKERALPSSANWLHAVERLIMHVINILKTSFYNNRISTNILLVA